jgi:peroxiredoxin family protein
VSQPLGILLLSGGHERAQYALVMATAAAAVGREVVLFATNEGCRLFAATAPLESDPREAEVASRGVAGVTTLLRAAEDLGVRLIACDAGLRMAGLAPESLRPGVEVAGVVTFLGAVGAGQLLSL